MGHFEFTMYLVYFYMKYQYYISEYHHIYRISTTLIFKNNLYQSNRCSTEKMIVFGEHFFEQMHLHGFGLTRCFTY